MFRFSLIKLSDKVWAQICLERVHSEIGVSISPFLAVNAETCPALLLGIHSGGKCLFLPLFPCAWGGESGGPWLLGLMNGSNVCIQETIQTVLVPSECSAPVAVITVIIIRVFGTEERQNHHGIDTTWVLFTFFDLVLDNMVTTIQGIPHRDLLERPTSGSDFRIIVRGLPWLSNGLESTFQCRGLSWGTKIPHNSGQLHWRTTTTEPMCYNEDLVQPK